MIESYMKGHRKNSSESQRSHVIDRCSNNINTKALCYNILLLRGLTTHAQLTTNVHCVPGDLDHNRHTCLALFPNNVVSGYKPF